MARGTLDTTIRVVEPPALDDLFPGCPLRLLGPPVPQTEVVAWMRANLSTMDAAVIDKCLLRAFSELCKVRDVSLTKQIVAKRTLLRAERGHLQIDHVVIDKVE
jgi:hypothetical protein